MSIRWHFGNAMYSEVTDDGWVACQPDAYGEGQSGCPPYESAMPYGFISRPLDPEKGPNGEIGVGCPYLYFTQGGEGFGWATQDPRHMDIVPRIKKGESAWYGPTGQFGRMRVDGSIAFMATDDATPTGKPITLALGPSNPEGTKPMLDASSPYWRIYASPLAILMQHASGASLTMGVVGMPSGPLSAAKSQITLEADLIHIKGGAVSLGNDGGAANDSSVAQLVTFLTLFATKVATITTSTPGATAMVDVLAALTTLQTQLAGIGKTP